MRFVPIFVLVSCLLQLVYANSNCSDSEFKSTSGLCCKLCPEGKYLLKECTQNEDTKCQVCPSDEFTAVENSLKSCHKCSNKKTCDGGRVVKRECIPTSDIVCECPSNEYWNHNTIRCEFCTVCQKGEKTTKCQKEKDATCEACPKGTYLDEGNNKCKTCSYCNKGQVVAEECQIWKDTQCRKEKEQVINELPTKKNKPSIPTQVTHDDKPTPEVRSSSESRSQKGDAGKILPPKKLKEPQIFNKVTWVSLAFNILLFCVVLFLTWPWWKRHMRRIRKTPVPQGKANPAATVIATSKSRETVKENNVKFSTLPATVTEDLGMLLNAKPGKNWKHLAGEMGFNSVYTQNLELTPGEATQKLLHEWEQKDDSTIFRLYSFLDKLGRHDACGILLPFLTKQANGEEVV